MKRIISVFITVLLILSVYSCGIEDKHKSISGTASSAAALMIKRIGAVPADVILGDSETAAAYGIDMSGFEDEGYIVRSEGGRTLVFGKTEDGLDRAARYYINHCNSPGGIDDNTSLPANKVYGEGYRVERLTVCGRDISEYAITLPESSPEGSYPESTGYAASELAKIVKDACGTELRVISETELVEGVPYIQFAVDGSGEHGDEGFTVAVNTDGNITVTGGLKRGCLYAVYDLAERWLGFRFITADFTYIYEAAHIDITPEMGYSDAPKLELRNPYTNTVNPGLPGFADPDNASFAAKHKLHSYTSERKYGCLPVLSGNHGLWYYWGTGPSDANLCFSDDYVFEEIIGNLGFELETAKRNGALYEGNYYHVNLGYNDNNSYCLCERCIAIAKEEGSISGPYARLVKKIADYFAGDYPEAVFGMIAYYGLEKPCTLTRLPDNVTVTYCIYDPCFSGPLDGSGCRADRENFYGIRLSDHIENIAGWKKVTDNLFMDLYYFSLKLGIPNNMIHNIYWDIKYLYEFGINGVFAEIENTVFAYDFPGTYLFAKMLWNPEMSYEEYMSLTEEYMRLYYGEGYAYLLDQLDVYNKMILCADGFGGQLDMRLYEANGDYILHLFDQAELLADSACTEKNVRILSAHAKYNVLCLRYRDMYIDGDEEERKYIRRLYTEVYDIIKESGATWLDLFGDYPVPEFDFDVDPSNWV